MAITRMLRRSLIRIDAATSIDRAARLLADADGLCVEEDGQLLGVLDARSLLAALRAADFDVAAPVGLASITPLPVLPADIDVDAAITSLDAAGARHGALVENGRPRYLVSRERLTSYRLDQLRHENRALEAFLNAASAAD